MEILRWMLQLPWTTKVTNNDCQTARVKWFQKDKENWNIYTTIRKVQCSLILWESKQWKTLERSIVEETLINCRRLTLIWRNIINRTDPEQGPRYVERHDLAGHIMMMKKSWYISILRKLRLFHVWCGIYVSFHIKLKFKVLSQFVFPTLLM